METRTLNHTRKRKAAIIVLLSVLGALNYIKWFSGEDERKPDISQRGVADSAFYTNLALTKIQHRPKELHIKRDLFKPIKKITKKKKPVVDKKPARPAKADVREKPSAAEIARKRARNRLDNLQLLGILEKNGRRRAFLSYEDELYIVHQGETIQDIFSIDVIKNVDISVTDIKSSLHHNIRLLENGK